MIHFTESQELPELAASGILLAVTQLQIDKVKSTIAQLTDFHPFPVKFDKICTFVKSQPPS